MEPRHGISITLFPFGMLGQFLEYDPVCIVRKVKTLND